jgi:carbamoyltransferase
LNCVANSRILSDGPFNDLWIQPAAGDAGGALGVALLVWHQLLGNPRRSQPDDRQRGSFLGPKYNEDTIRQFLDDSNAVYHHLEEDKALCQRVSQLIAEEKVVGWFQGRMEFGPRALGGRSILGDARSATMQAIMNRKIKFRESFRPFAPSVLRDQAADYFDFDSPRESPYMLLVAPIRDDKRCTLEDSDRQRDGLEKRRPLRSVVPAITHVDYSARVQTVDARRHGRFHQLLETFHGQTGSPVLINTSFNIRGEPIVCSPQDAYQCFMATNMDALVLERILLLKSEQPYAETHEIDDYLARFDLD